MTPTRTRLEAISPKQDVAQSNIQETVIAPSKRTSSTKHSSVSLLFSMFANICSSASSANPHATLNKFFALQQLMDQPNGTTQLKDKSLQLHKIPTAAEKHKSGKSARLMPAKSTSKSPKPLTELLGSEKQEWAKGNGMKEINELREVFLNETRSWFLSYLEKTLDTGFSQEKGKDIAGRQMGEANHIALTLSHLKHANEWLDKVRSSSNTESEGLVEIVDRLKQKVYSCLLVHVDSAALALENRA